MKPATVRYYFDADVLGLGKVVARLGPDATYPGDQGALVHKQKRSPCVISSADVADVDWIPLVAADKMVAISRDSRISRRIAEIDAVVQHKLRLVVLTSADARTVWTQLEVLMCQWRGIERLVDIPGPCIYRASRTRLQAMHL
ncbi:MAG: hypothetical protein OXE79_07050 [Acidimicrobiaceae bacterium]|nr:hypothetical protein [Acidimicrobiaceae bacterium]MCY4281114.1 hypothetical protein [Acidimicrobiaceae bacterium]MCY4294024.1 hypothetical protein [Acidimicrobiaceae bacterium]